MEGWALFLRIGALMMVATATGVSLTYRYLLRSPFHRGNTGLNLILFLSLLSLAVLTENFLVRMYGWPLSWITLGANMYFIILGLVLVRSAVGIYRFQTEQRFAEQVEQEVLRKLRGEDE